MGFIMQTENTEAQTVNPTSLVTPDESAPPTPPDGTPGADPADLMGGEGAPPAPSAPSAPSAPVPPAPAPGRRGQHKKGCKCGRCKWSRPGTGSKTTESTGGTETADFSDLGVDGGATQTADFSDLATPAPEKAVDYDMLAGMSFDMTTNTLALVLGNEWQPQNDTERAVVVGAVKTYLQAKQVQDIPPGMLLAIVLTAYAAPRLRAPNTASKLSLAWAWFKSKLRRRHSLQLVQG